MFVTVDGEETASKISERQNYYKVEKV